MSTRNDDQRREGSPRYSREQQPFQPRVTDQEIQKWISRQHGFVPESAWLLHCKEQFGLVATGTAPKENPCPPEKVAAIQQAFRRFGLL
jgi:hypothetical protein